MGDIVAWLPYASPEEAADRLGGIPDGVRVDCYRADGDDFPARSARRSSTCCRT